MAALMVLIALCLVGVTVAAPQLSLGGQRSFSPQFSTSSPDSIVSDVVSALQPSITAAIQEALAAQAKAANQRQRQAQAGAAAASSSTEDPLAEDPKYNFEYKVAAEEDQTYITQSEERDGEALSGTYSYVDARGALVTVNYAAGPEGYSESREEQLGFLAVRPQPARIEPQPAPSPPKVDQATLIQRILAILQPQIGQAVSGALSAQREAANAARLEAERLEAAAAAAERQRIAAAAAAAERQRLAAAAAAAERQRLAQLEQQRLAAEARARAEAERIAAEAAASTGSLSLFGDGGYSVKVETPDFKIQY